MPTRPWMPARYAVFGHPIGHSKSPLIHAAFARQTGQDMRYEAILAPIDGFADALRAFREAGGQGANVTVPFKEQAFQLCGLRSARAELAGAVNTLSFTDDAILGDNTDGAGLTADLTRNLGFAIRNKHVLLMGAGGAARGVIGPLLEHGPASLFIANRTAQKAVELAGHFRQHLPSPTLPTRGEGEDRHAVLLPHASGEDQEGGVFAAGFDALPGRRFDLVINATAASLGGELPPLPADLFAPDALAYDMMYGRDTPFLAFARAHGAHCADGLGMLVEQAAEAFLVWRGVRPDTAPVIAQLRAS